MNKICLISITASHYRSLIYSLMDKELSCDFIFGKHDTTIRLMDASILTHSIFVPNRFIYNTSIYYQPDTLRQTGKYNVIINDLGILCLTSWLLLLKAKIRHQRLYHWDHGWYGRESLLKKIIKRCYFALADGAFLYGNYARDKMMENGFDGRKLHVIHNSLDYDQQLDIRRKMQPTKVFSSHFGNENKVIIFIGRLTEVKSLDILVSSIAILSKRGEPYNLVIIGDGDIREQLQKQADKESIKDSTWFYGASYDETMNAELIYNADLCVSPGNVGLTAMHTMMYGCPVITHDDLKWQMPEFEAIRKGITGDFFTRGNAESLANAVSAWFYSQGYDRDKIRQACYKEIDSEWNPHNQIEILKKVVNG